MVGKGPHLPILAAGVPLTATAKVAATTTGQDPRSRPSTPTTNNRPLGDLNPRGVGRRLSRPTVEAE